ncbi:MAG: hypothetical protein OJF51_003927 [Nitrospira sp.]|jgi:hypothetical protein|nr:MAG: hypothetical protein OJF51_003927 [Nitrospira sp.]
MVSGMSHTRIIKWSVGISLAMSVSVCWSLSYAGTTRDGHSPVGQTMPHMMTSSTFTGTEVAVKPIPSAAVPAENGFVLRNIPTVSKPISVGGTILVPYIGAGFGGGYATELDRSLNTAQSASSGSLNAGLKNLFGPQLIPNEVQLGVRFPF